MPCPFPGMDPYIERSALWSDFHDSLIACIRGALQPLIRPKYAALTQDRLFVVESDRPIYPDVALLRNPPSSRDAPGTMTLEPDAPAVFELWREEIRQPFLTIIEPAAGNRVITAIEVLSPTNKEQGEGRDSYMEKREEYWNGGVNLVEIDLLRGGDPTIRLGEEKLAQLRPWHYLVAITRRCPARQEVYSVSLERNLPKVAIPLAAQDKDVTLDLQAVFARCWDEGPYPELLRYDGPPPGKISAEEAHWCEEVLLQAGFRLSK
jgi:hypothetical protein